MSEQPQESPSPSATRRRRVRKSDGSDSGRTAGGLQRRFVDVLGWTITAVWAASFIVDALVRTYDPPVSIHALMMIVAGAAFGSALIQRGD